MATSPLGKLTKPFPANRASTSLGALNIASCFRKTRPLARARAPARAALARAPGACPQANAGRLFNDGGGTSPLLSFSLFFIRYNVNGNGSYSNGNEDCCGYVTNEWACKFFKTITAISLFF